MAGGLLGPEQGAEGVGLSVGQQEHGGVDAVERGGGLRLTGFRGGRAPRACEDPGQLGFTQKLSGQRSYELITLRPRGRNDAVDLQSLNNVSPDRLFLVVQECVCF